MYWIESTKSKVKRIIMSEKTVYSNWIKKGPNVFIPTDNPKILPKVDAGIYDLKISEGIGFYMMKRETFLDDLLEFPSNIQSEVLNSVKDFWTRREKFSEYGFAFKRGILLHGKPGSGKSCIISLVMKHMVEKMDGVILPLRAENELSMYAGCIPEVFRIIEKDRPIIVVFEDIENMCHGSTETLLLNVLDGLDQLENVVYLATTNYIEKLKERIINRPSRFDRRVYVPFLDYSDRLFYFEKKLKPADLDKYDIKQWAYDTENMSIAHLAELLKSVVIFGNDYNEVIAILKEMNKFNDLNSKDYEKQQSDLGFNIKGGKSTANHSGGSIIYHEATENGSANSKY